MNCPIRAALPAKLNNVFVPDGDGAETSQTEILIEEFAAMALPTALIITI